MTIGNVYVPFQNKDRNNIGYGIMFQKTWGGANASIPKYEKLTPVPSFAGWCAARGVDLTKVPRRRKFQVLERAYQSWRRDKDNYHQEMGRRKTQREARRLALKRNPNPYECSVIRAVVPLMDYVQPEVPLGGSHADGLSSSSVFSSSTLTNPWNANDDLNLINKLRGQMDGGVGFNAAIATAEADESLRLISTSAKKFRRAGEQLAKGDLAGAAHVIFNGSSSHSIKGFEGLKGIADNYLLWQFGVRPLLHDVVDGSRALGYLSERPALQKLRVRRKVEASERTAFSSGAYYASADYVCKGQIIAYLRGDPHASVSLALTDLPSAAWERLPFSFIVDWWVPVSQYLEAQQLSRQLDATFVQTTVIQRRDYGPESGTGPSRYSIRLHGKYMYKSITMRRTVNSSLFVPTPTMKPLFHKDASVRLRHTLEAVALVVSRGKFLSKQYRKLAKKALEYQAYRQKRSLS